jgi:hypothetical protein
MASRGEPHRTILKEGSAAYRGCGYHRKLNRPPPESSDPSLSAGLTTDEGGHRVRTARAVRIFRVKAIWTSRVNETAVKYGEHVPMATACCNVCRTCVQTNVLGLALAGIVGAAGVVTRLLRRPATP